VGSGGKTSAGSKLRVSISGLELEYPTMLASGVLATSKGIIASLMKTEGLGGIVTKSATIEPREGYPTPVVAGESCFVINAMGLPNPGYEELSREIREVIASEPPSRKVRLIASIAASTPKEAEVMGGAFEEAGVDAIELNLSCPHARGLGLEVGREPDLVREIVSSTVSTVRIPVMVKIGFSDNAKSVAIEAEKAGASAIVAINTIRGTVIDVYAKMPVLSNVYGGVSGPALRPIALGVVYELYEELSIPIIGCGGVDSWKSAVEFILAGAKAVQVGTAVAYRGLGVFKEIAIGILRYLEEEGFRHIDEIVGLAHKR